MRNGGHCTAIGVSDGENAYRGGKKGKRKGKERKGREGEGAWSAWFVYKCMLLIRVLLIDANYRNGINRNDD